MNSVEYNIKMGVSFNRKRKDMSRSKNVIRKIVKSLKKDGYTVATFLLRDSDNKRFVKILGSQLDFE